MGDIARKFRVFTSNRTVTFSVVGTKWKHVVLRDNTLGSRWSRVRFNSNGTGSFDVNPGGTVTYEIAFTENDFAIAERDDGLQTTGVAEYLGTDVSVDPGDPAPPPDKPRELFLLSSMVHRVVGGLFALRAANTDAVATIASAATIRDVVAAEPVLTKPKATSRATAKAAPTATAKAAAKTAPRAKRGATPVAQLTPAKTKTKAKPKAKPKAKSTRAPTSRRGRVAQLSPPGAKAKAKAKVKVKAKAKAKRPAARRASRSRAS